MHFMDLLCVMPKRETVIKTDLKLALKKVIHMIRCNTHANKDKLKDFIYVYI